MSMISLTQIFTHYDSVIALISIFKYHCTLNIWKSRSFESESVGMSPNTHKWPEVTQFCPTLQDPMDCTVHGILHTRILGWVAFPSPGIFPAQGSNQGLPHCTQILYQLSHKASPRILDRVAYHFSRGSSWPRNWTEVTCIVGGFFTKRDIREWLQTLLIRKLVCLI